MIINNIVIRNIYEMLVYIFDIHEHDDCCNLDTEKFDNVESLLGEFLCFLFSKRLKRGLHKEYTYINNDLKVLHGKVNIANTIKNKIKQKQELNCDFDELSENILLNQIVKLTIFELLKKTNLNKGTREKLKTLWFLLNDIKLIEYKTVVQSKILYKKVNKDYEIIINICYLILNSLILTTDIGEYRLKHFYNTAIDKIFEKFVLKYYQKEYSKTCNVYPKKIQWGDAEGDIDFLQNLQTDITIEGKFNNKSLIIDTKFYSKIFQENFDKQKFNRDNIFQIFTYVTNYDYANKNKKVAGMLLYAKTQEIEELKKDFKLCGNDFSIRAIDLSLKFNDIKKQLNDIFLEKINI